jgi:hypothetical protein
MIVLLGIYAASLYGPPPPSRTALGLGDIVLVLLLATLAGWADRRASRTELHARHLPVR